MICRSCRQQSAYSADSIFHSDEISFLQEDPIDDDELPPASSVESNLDVMNKVCLVVIPPYI